MSLRARTGLVTTVLDGARAVLKDNVVLMLNRQQMNMVAAVQHFVTPFLSMYTRLTCVDDKGNNVNVIVDKDVTTNDRAPSTSGVTTIGTWRVLSHPTSNLIVIYQEQGVIDDKSVTKYALVFRYTRKLDGGTLERLHNAAMGVDTFAPLGLNGDRFVVETVGKISLFDYAASATAVRFVLEGKKWFHTEYYCGAYKNQIYRQQIESDDDTVSINVQTGDLPILYVDHVDDSFVWFDGVTMWKDHQQITCDEEIVEVIASQSPFWILRTIDTDSVPKPGKAAQYKKIMDELTVQAKNTADEMFRVVRQIYKDKKEAWLASARDRMQNRAAVNVRKVLGVAQRVIPGELKAARKRFRVMRAKQLAARKKPKRDLPAVASTFVTRRSPRLAALAGPEDPTFADMKETLAEIENADLEYAIGLYRLEGKEMILIPTSVGEHSFLLPNSRMFDAVSGRISRPTS